MRKFWSKALFRKELNSLLLFSGSIFGILVANKIYPLMMYLNYIKLQQSLGNLSEDMLAQWFNQKLLGDFETLVPLLLFIIAFLATRLFKDIRGDNTGDLLASMPLTRKQIIRSKGLMGAVAVAAPFLLTFIILSIFYWSNSAWIHTPYKVIPIWISINLFVYLTVYSFLFLVQTLMGQSTYSGIVGVICLFIPWYLLAGTTFIMESILRIPYMSIVDGLAYYSLIWVLLYPKVADGATIGIPINHYYYPHLATKLVILLVLVIGFYWIAERAFLANRVEKNGHLLMFSYLEPVFIWGFAFCLGLLVPGIFGLGKEPFTTLLFLALGMVVGYFLAKGAVAMTKDH